MEKNMKKCVYVCLYIYIYVHNIYMYETKSICCTIEINTNYKSSILQ